MRSPLNAWPLIVLLLMLLTGCASSPSPATVQRPAAPAEMMISAPPPGYFATQIEMILSRLPGKPTP